MLFQTIMVRAFSSLWPVWKVSGTPYTSQINRIAFSETRYKEKNTRKKKKTQRKQNNSQRCSVLGCECALIMTDIEEEQNLNHFHRVEISNSRIVLLSASRATIRKTLLIKLFLRYFTRLYWVINKAESFNTRQDQVLCENYHYFHFIII